MNHSILALSSFMLCGYMAGCSQGKKSKPVADENQLRPNIILIMADDLGWGDVGFNSNRVIKTPSLDEMAKNGLVFSRFYAAAPVCSPTRGSCLTGRHPHRYGIETANVGKMEPDEVTLAEYLKQKGYSTGHFGKWHLGTLTNDEPDANRGGSDTSFYSPPWANGFDVCFSTESKVPTWNPMDSPPTDSGNIGEKAPGTHFGTYYWAGPWKKVTDNLQGDDSRIIMDRVIPFINEQVDKKKPFLAVIWFHTPHLPVLTGEEYRSLYSGYSLDEQHYFGAITAMDQQIGRLNQKIKELSQDNNTLIFFTSDNGPEGKAKNGRTQGCTGGFKGRKRSLYEGGIRVPGIAVWPTKIKSGQRTDFPAVTSDYLPTILDVLGEKNKFPVTPVDGISLVDVWDANISKRPSPIGFQFDGRKALLDNRYKLIQNKNDTFELYDLLKDPFETIDISSENPDTVQVMKDRLNSFVFSCEESRKGLNYD